MRMTDADGAEFIALAMGGASQEQGGGKDGQDGSKTRDHGFLFICWGHCCKAACRP
jgi:hypothetical protein